MMIPMRVFSLCLLVLLLAGCSSNAVKAPVGARGAQSQTGSMTAGKRQPAATGDYYVVRRGDTLYSIAWQYGLSSQQLASLNAIRPPYTIYAGQRLRTRTTVRAPAPSRLPPASRPKPMPAPAATRTRSQAAPAPSRSIARSAPAPKSKPKPAVSPKPVSAREPALPTQVGNWVWPARGKLLHGFQPSSNGKKGIDIAGTSGQSVMAAAAGKVVYSGSGLVGYGRLIIIKHNESLLSAYGHNSKLLVSEGEHVKAGQVIARMGSSGTDRVQLYFEIRKNGKPVNPLHYLPKG